MMFLAQEQVPGGHRGHQGCHKRGQPVLVGTTSIETSELLSALLRKQGVPHEVLNAKQHEREAQIVAQAGRPGTVTIATNMAGRGTDIVLGGSLEAELERRCRQTLPKQIARASARSLADSGTTQVLAAGGLHIIGTERHESRRIDNQLRGRSGRQGDPGSSRFYLSLEDNLMRIFAGDRVGTLDGAFRHEGRRSDGRPHGHRQIEKAQRKVEPHNFDIRKNLLEYDDVANDQRKVIYEQRNELLEADDVAATVADIRDDVVEGMARALRAARQRGRAVGHGRARSRRWKASSACQARSQPLGRSIDEVDAAEDPSPQCAEAVDASCSRPRKNRSAPKSCVSWKSTSC